MCGIVGGNCPDWDYEGALNSIRHRGPDSQKVICEKNIGLGFVRLSIIDISEAAMQPMKSEDGRYTIVFNGEIYAYDKIRKLLESKGYHFRTKSDTEVLLYSFVEWKDKLMNYLDGIFAFAIYDSLDNKIYLFRDRVGVKPLYYFYDGKNFAFASELKAIKTMCKNCHFSIDSTALYDYHTYMYIPTPKTMYKNVYKLEPATYIVFDIKSNRIIEKSKYWKIRLNTKEGNRLGEKQLKEKAHELRWHLSNVINRQLVADVPIGTFLSGGVDSSIITAEVRNHKKNIKAYTIGFADSRYDESKYAQKIASILNVDCKTKYFQLRDFNRLYRNLPNIYDEPFADTSAYPTLFVSEYAKSDVTVVLSGDGGDELFGGYPRCIFAQDTLDKKVVSNRILSEFYLCGKKRLAALGTQLEVFCKEDVALLADQYTYGIGINRKKLREKYSIPFDYDDFWYIRKYYHKDLPPYTRMRYLDFMTYLEGDILTKVDRASMKVSLEVRVPFLDKEMIDFAFSLSQEACNPNGELKGLLKRAYDDIIPRKLFDRKKQGFSIPFSYLRDKRSPQENLLEDLWNM